VEPVDYRALKDLLDALKSGDRKGASLREKDKVAQAAIAVLGVEHAVKLLTRSVTYEEMLKMADEWTERFGVDRQVFVKAYRPKERKRKQKTPQPKAQKKEPEAGEQVP
jgi:hypothetical protein